MAEQLSDKYKIPETLRPLLEALARETIRAQPTDVVSFGKLFFDILSHHQQDSDKSILTDNVSYDMFRMDLQQRYKNIMLKENMTRSVSPEDVAATKIQAAFRGHQVRMHPERYGVDAELVRRRSSDKLATLDFNKDQKRHSIGGYSLEHSQTPENRAATKIQAEFRGYLARKNIQAMREQNDNAATKIQAHVRGFLTRKRLGKEGLISPSRSHSSLQSHKSEEN